MSHQKVPPKGSTPVLSAGTGPTRPNGYAHLQIVLYFSEKDNVARGENARAISQGRAFSSSDRLIQIGSQLL